MIHSLHTSRWRLCILLTAVLYLLVQYDVYAQDPRFKKLDVVVSEGEEEHTCIFQDTDGLIWLGTSGGLYMFDGIRFSAVAMPDSMKNVGVSAFWQDSGASYWIGYETGDVYRFDGTASFQPMYIPEYPAAYTTSFLEDDSGQIWIGTYGQGVRVVTKDRVLLADNDTGLTDNYIYTMVKGPHGRIWMGTDNGINIAETVHSKGSLFINIKAIGLNEGLPDLIIRSFDRDPQGRIWIGMHNGGIAWYDPGTEKFILPEGLSSWRHGPVLDLLFTGNNLWIATARKGIVEYLPSTGKTKRYARSGNSILSRIKSLMRDKEGNLWLLGPNELWMSFANKLRFLEAIGDVPIRNIHAVVIDKNEELWFANDQGVFSFPIHQTNEPPLLNHHPLRIDLKKQKIMSLFFDAYDHLWIGTFGQGVIRMDPKTGEQKIFDANDGLKNGNILSIAGDEKQIWFGTLGGAYRIAAGRELRDLNYRPEFEHFGRDQGLVNNYIYQVVLTEAGTPYFATDGNGVFVLEEGHFDNIFDTASGVKNVVYSLNVGPGGNLWLNRANEGLMYYNGSRYVRINADEAHKSVVFSGIFHNRNELVMVYNNGVDILNLYTGSIRHYESNAGIEAINPDLNTIAADSSENVWIGTAKGLLQYRPPKEPVLDHPVTRLNRVSLFLEPVDPSDHTRFNHRENHFTFSFSGLWYQYPERVEYMVKLEGHDLNWIKTRNNQVIYSDLRPDRYTFRVKSGIYGNFKDSNEVSYSFVIRKPFYQSGLFYILLIMTVTLIVWGIIRQRIARVKRREELIQERIRYQFENLKSQLNPHFLFNSFSTLIALIEDDSREAVKYVEELSNLFRIVLEYKDQDLITLEQECRLADNYIRLQKRRFGKNLQVNIRDDQSFHRIHIPPLTLQLLIENAIKHNIVSKDKPLLVEVYVDSEHRTICVENNIQIKKEENTSLGIGINNIINRYKLLTERKVQVTENTSVFRIALPII